MSRARLHQLRGDAQAVTGAAQAASQHIRGIQVLADFWCRTASRGRQNRGRRENPQFLDLREFGDDVFGDAVAEVFVFLGAAQIGEVENRDGLLDPCLSTAASACPSAPRLRGRSRCHASDASGPRAFPPRPGNVIRDLFQGLLDDAVGLGRDFRFERAAGVGVRFRTASKMIAEVPPEKACRPVAISYSTTPKENKSVRASTSSPRACSGDM